MTTPAPEPSSMRPSKFLNKTVRPKKNRKPAGSFRNYKKVADAERQRAIERIFGSQGPASAVRKIDPETGQVVATIDAH
jgi:hypothetical protein